MQKNPYIILGLTDEATLEEVENAYRTLRAKYSNLRFEEGEIGANASKMLGQIENAYKDCIDDLKRKEIKNNYNGNEYGEIENKIKEGRLEEAQSMLDDCDERDAQWHYYQAQIYYKRQWHEEAKNQLEIACDLDPENGKYKTTLEKLERVINGENNKDYSQEQKQENKQENRHNSRAGYTRPNNASGASDSDACCNACSTLLCADCCCECMGGDLIPCC